MLGRLRSVGHRSCRNGHHDCLWPAATAAPWPTMAAMNANPARPRVYLAGPDVFLPDSRDVFARLRASCARLGLEGVEPSDGGLAESGAQGATDDELAQRIFEGNVRLIHACDGVIANLKGVCDLADKYDALVMVDDSHAVGFVGENGRGSHEYCDVMGRVDIITGTLGKALGGASGGYTAARKEVVEWLRQRSRPYLFSNSLAPAIVAASIKVLEMVESGAELRDRLWSNALLFREKMSAAGFTLAGADHAIFPVMLGDAVVAQQFARELQKEGIYVTGFFFPVVPKGQARIRTQMSAAHTPEQIERAVEAFTRIGKQLGVIA